MATNATRTGYLPFAFDQTHVINAVLSYKFANNWALGVTLHYNSGRPETGIGTSRTERVFTRADGTQDWGLVSADEADRLPGFFRLDVRASKSWAYEAYTLELYLDFLNVAFRQETIVNEYIKDPFTGALTRESTAVPIALPILGLKGRY